MINQPRGIEGAPQWEITRAWKKGFILINGEEHKIVYNKRSHGMEPNSLVQDSKELNKVVDKLKNPGFLDRMVLKITPNEIRLGRYSIVKTGGLVQALAQPPLNASHDEIMEAARQQFAEDPQKEAILEAIAEHLKGYDASSQEKFNIDIRMPIINNPARDEADHFFRKNHFPGIGVIDA